MYPVAHSLLTNYCGGFSGSSLFAFLSFICYNEFAGESSGRFAPESREKQEQKVAGI